VLLQQRSEHAYVRTALAATVPHLGMLHSSLILDRRDDLPEAAATATAPHFFNGGVSTPTCERLS
jgi:hypothetical protein